MCIRDRDRPHPEAFDTVRPLLKNKLDVYKRQVITITSNRGLAGGYNNNLVKLVSGDSRLDQKNVTVYAIGRKGKDALSRKGYAVAADYSEVLNEPVYQDAAEITGELLKAFEKNEIGEIRCV